MSAEIENSEVEPTDCLETLFNDFNHRCADAWPRYRNGGSGYTGDAAENAKLALVDVRNHFAFLLMQQRLPTESFEKIEADVFQMFAHVSQAVR